MCLKHKLLAKQAGPCIAKRDHSNKDLYSYVCVCVCIPVCVCVLQEFKSEAYQLQIEMERLSHQAGLLLRKVTEEGDRLAIQEPVAELKMLWASLDEKIIHRQVSWTLWRDTGVTRATGLGGGIQASPGQQGWVGAYRRRQVTVGGWVCPVRPGPQGRAA